MRFTNGRNVGKQKDEPSIGRFRPSQSGAFVGPFGSECWNPLADGSQTTHAVPAAAHLGERVGQVVDLYIITR
jgi:hypothetical protein